MQRERERGDLEFSRFHGDGDADEEDAGHGDGSVALPVLGPAVGPTGHGPHLGPEITCISVMAVVSSSAHVWLSLSSLFFFFVFFDSQLRSGK